MQFSASGGSFKPFYRLGFGHLCVVLMGS